MRAVLGTGRQAAVVRITHIAPWKTPRLVRVPNTPFFPKNFVWSGKYPYLFGFLAQIWSGFVLIPPLQLSGVLYKSTHVFLTYTCDSISPPALHLRHPSGQLLTRHSEPHIRLPHHRSDEVRPKEPDYSIKLFPRTRSANLAQNRGRDCTCRSIYQVCSLYKELAGFFIHAPAFTIFPAFNNDLSEIGRASCRERV